VLGVEHTVIESVDLEPGGLGGEVLVAQVRPKASAVRRCSRCGRRCPGYDTSATPRQAVEDQHDQLAGRGHDTDVGAPALADPVADLSETGVPADALHGLDRGPASSVV